MDSRPIFIVGSPRSGTTLLAAMLAAHSKLSCGPETHFFRWLASADLPRLLNPADWPQTAADLVCSISRTSFSDEKRQLLINHYGIEREQIKNYLLSKEPSIAAIVSSVTETYMRQQRKQRWAEKTPDHVEHLPAIRAAFPGAQIIRITRDPRDVALSLSKVPWGVSSVLEGILFWRRQDELSREIFAQDDRSYTLQFERLITSPQKELENLCLFLGEEFEPQMLDTSKSGKKLNSRDVAWKSKSSQPIDHSRIQVWRRELSREENILAEALIGDRLLKYGFMMETEFNRVGEIYPSIELAVKFSAELGRLARQGTRFWKMHPAERIDDWIYLGDPEVDRWLNSGRLEKIRDTLAVSGKIIQRSIASERKIYWIPENRQIDWTGSCAFILKRLLRPHKFAVEI